MSDYFKQFGEEAKVQIQIRPGFVANVPLSEFIAGLIEVLKKCPD